VDEWSNGQLGYIHIRAMDQASLDDFERDLYAAAEGKRGLLIDVRNNGGGFTADLLLSSIMAQPHAYTVPRDGDMSVRTGYPQDRLFIQRYTLPINMLCNEKSFSNAEITSHAFKTLKRGTLIGQQTYGGVISTGGTSLLDGTTVRLPFRGWYLADGTDMENNGAIPDIIVPQTPEDESTATDTQLRVAVDDLLKRLPS
jgi:tricorn protease